MIQNDNFYLAEAFNRLSLLNEDAFDLSADKGVVDELQSFVADDIEAPFEEEIIDIEAEDEDELKNNYVGKVILQCECCHAKVYKEPNEVILDETGELANVDDECPVCNCMQGWKVIGKIEPFEETEEENKEEEEEVVEEPAEDEEQEFSDDEISEALREALGPDDQNKLDEIVNKHLTDAAYEAEVDHELDVHRNDMEKAEAAFNDDFYFGDVDESCKNEECKDCKEECDKDLEEKYDESLNEEVEPAIDEQEASEDAVKLEDSEQEPILESLGEPLEEGFLGAILGGIAGNKIGGAIGHDLAGTSIGAALGSALGDAVYNKVFGKVLDDENSIGTILRKALLAAAAGGGVSFLNNKTGIVDQLASLINSKITAKDLTPEGVSLLKEINTEANNAKDENDSKNLWNKLTQLLNNKGNLFTNFGANIGKKIANKIGGVFQQESLEEELDDVQSEDAEKLVDPEENPVNESLNEDVNISVDVDGQNHIEIEPQEDGGINVEVSPADAGVDNIPADAETIAPLDDEDKNAIEGNDGIAPEEAPVEDEFAIDDFDEESFDELGESFLKRVYDNADSYKTTKVTQDGSKLVVEGMIKFKSGKEKSTSFIFEKYKNTKRGKLMIEGMNETFSKSNKAFLLKGTLENKKYTCESLTYNYNVSQLNESNESETIHVYGRAVRK